MRLRGLTFFALLAAALLAPLQPTCGQTPAMSARVDALLAEQWEAADVAPADLSSDGEFLRRAYLDFVGVVPRVSEVRRFLADQDPNKRQALIARLLDSPRYATHMATTWRNRIVPGEVEPQDLQQALGLEKWLRTRFAKNLRYDNIVGGLLATGGDELGPALYFQVNDVAPEKLAASTSELFLGVKLQCAMCHDHPYADWKQTDFWGLAAFFARVEAPRDMQTMQADYRIVDRDRGEVMLPDTNQVIAPQFLGGGVVEDSPRQSRRVQLTLWMTQRNNRLFSRAAVNWAWSHLFGETLVPAVDVPRDHEQSLQVNLLDQLADEFVRSQFDLKQLWLTLASTKAYQLSSRHPQSSPLRLFAHMQPKPLTPEQLYDSFAQISPTPSSPTTLPSGDAQAMLMGDPARLDFVRQMRTPAGSPLEFRASSLQALLLMNGPATTAITDSQRGRMLAALGAPYLDTQDQIDTLFLATLARLPDSEELEFGSKTLEACETDDQRRQVLGDLMWALVNSTEFAFRQ